MLTISSTEVISSRTLLVTFSEPLSLLATNFDEVSYSVPGLVIRGVLPPPVDNTAPSSVLLVTEYMDQGSTYTLSAVGLEAASANTFDPLVTSTFVATRTKLDKVLTETPILYNTSPYSAYMQLLTAIHRENNKIGGADNN